MIGSSIGQKDTTDTEQRSFKEATYFGGGLGLQFGTITSIQVSPSLAYKVDRKGKLSTGIGLMYWYYRDNRFTPAFESSTYGYSLFSRFRVVESIFLHAEFQQQSVQVGNAALVDGNNNLPREWVPLLLVGGGYSAHLGGNSYLIAQVLWDVIQDRRSPYLVGQPFFSVGVGVGF
jgi:hypothetical protein